MVNVFIKSDQPHETGVRVYFRGKSRWLKDLGYTIQDEADLYDQCLQDIFNNTRFYLDNFHLMQEFKVSWTDYKSSKITKPYKFCNESYKNCKKIEEK